MPIPQLDWLPHTVQEPRIIFGTEVIASIPALMAECPVPTGGVVPCFVVYRLPTGRWSVNQTDEGLFLDNPNTARPTSFVSLLEAVLWCENCYITHLLAYLKAAEPIINANVTGRG